MTTQFKGELAEENQVDLKNLTCRKCATISIRRLQFGCSVNIDTKRNLFSLLLLFLLLLLLLLPPPLLLLLLLLLCLEFEVLRAQSC